MLAKYETSRIDISEAFDHNLPKEERTGPRVIARARSQIRLICFVLIFSSSSSDHNAHCPSRAQKAEQVKRQLAFISCFRLIWIRWLFRPLPWFGNSARIFRLIRFRWIVWLIRFRWIVWIVRLIRLIWIVWNNRRRRHIVVGDGEIVTDT